MKFRKVPYEDWRGTVLGRCDLKHGHVDYYKSVRNKGGWGVSYCFGGSLPLSGAEVHYSEESAKKRYKELLPKRGKKSGLNK